MQPVTFLNMNPDVTGIFSRYLLGDVQLVLYFNLSFIPKIDIFEDLQVI